jgi:hypothetical protein
VRACVCVCVCMCVRVCVCVKSNSTARHVCSSLPVALVVVHLWVANIVLVINAL